MQDNTAEDLSNGDSTNAKNQKIDCRPFVKWVGGKGQLLDQLVKRIPTKVNRYFEPFVGGGALLFGYQPKSGYISDLNPELINAYQVIKSDVEALIRDLEKHRYEEKYYYATRNIDRTSDYQNWSPIERASRLIFLNKTCYNGLYRVNSKGHFNTPFGKYTNPTIVDKQNLRACNKLLQNVDIRVASFEEIEDRLDPNDFIYFDPPYVPLTETANFTSYHSEKFDVEMQKRLFEFCCRLDKKKIRFMLSNSSAPFVTELYAQFKIELVPATRAINSNAAKRGQIDEVIVTNY